MTSGANEQAKVLQFAAFREHSWEHVALYPGHLLDYDYDL